MILLPRMTNNAPLAPSQDSYNVKKHKKSVQKQSQQSSQNCFSFIVKEESGGTGEYPLARW